MNPLAQNCNNERVTYDFKKGPPPPYPTSKPILTDATCTANRTFVHSTPSYSQRNTSAKPVENTLQAFNQMIGTVQPMAQAQVYKSQQVLSIVKANSQTQNTLIHEALSQPMSQTIAAPEKRQATIQPKDNLVTSKRVQQLALNGLVWMTTSGQTVQTANVHNIHSAKVMQAFNPVIAYQNQNVGHSSKMLISVTSANGSIPHVSMGQGHVNVSESQGNCSSALSILANNFVKCNDQIPIQTANGKVGVDQDQYKAQSAVASNTAVQLCQRNWPALTNCVSRPALTYGTQTRVGSSQASERTGSSVCLSSQQSTTNSWFSPTNSNGQKRMVLARVTPMSHDWRNLQQNSHTFHSADTSKVKNLHAEDTRLHLKLCDQNRALEDASSTSEKSVEMKNQTTTQSSTAGINAQRNNLLAPAAPPLTIKPSLYRQQNVHNIHFFYTPSTMNEHSIIASIPSDVNGQHNVMAPGNPISSTVGSQNTVSVSSQLSPLSVGHCNFGVSPTGSSNLNTQKTVTGSAVEGGALYNTSDHQSSVPPADPPHSMNVLYSTIRLASKDVAKQTIHLVSSGSNSPSAAFSSENSVPSPVHLSSRGDYGKQSTAGLVLVIPPSVVVHNCQNVEAASVCSPSTVLTHEKNMPLKLTEHQGETSDSVVEVPTSVSEKSATTLSPVASPLSLTGQQCEKMLGINSSTIRVFSEQQTNCENPPLEPNQKSPTGMLSSSTDLNGKKNIILDIGTLSKESSTEQGPMSCDSQENLILIDSPPQKRFLASAVEDTLKDANGCENAVVCVDKSINSSELITSSEDLAKNEATIADQTVARDDTVQPEIYITGVFSLGGNTGLWGSVQQSSSCPSVDLTSPSEEVNNSSATKGLANGESSLKDKGSHEHCNTLVKENVQLTCVPPSNLESRQCSSDTESHKMEHAQSVLESSVEKNIGQQISKCDEGPASILIDLTGDEDDFTEPLQTDSVLPSDFKEQDENLVSDQSVLPVEINSPSLLKSSEKGTQDLDDLLHSIDTAIEAFLNFWNPYPPAFSCGNTGKLTCKQYNLQEGETSECKLPNVAEETALTSFEEAHMIDEGAKAGLHEDSDCNSPYNIKVLGHTEILNLLDEISKSISNERLPAEAAGSETFSRSVVRLTEETQSKASQSASSDGWKASSSKALVMRLSGKHGADQNHALLQSVSNKNSSAKKGKREKKEYCCINAWLAASGVLGIYCHCKFSQGNKTENQADLPNTIHESQNNNETSNPNCVVKPMEIETVLHSVPNAAPGKHVLEIPENWNSVPRSCTSIVPDSNHDKVMGEVQQEVCGVAEAMQQQSSESSTRVVENERQDLCKPGNANVNRLNMSEELDKLTCRVSLERKFDLKEIKNNKANSQNEVEIEAAKETWTVLEEELNGDKMKNVSRDPSQHVLNEETSDQTDTQKVKQHLGVKQGTKGKKRKAAKSHSLHKNNHTPRKKTRCDIADAKLLPNYNCRVMIRDKTYSSSGERAVLVSLLPVSGQTCKTREKARAKPQ
ncbi:uro-adherence factor A-like isoform X3 [Heterodontus francisci]|uniref:uro-adherence factor A-like isoform X3 n=1 Tax=Heterodontus francisci TaxID=7792 RepID=UPI00355AF5B6